MPSLEYFIVARAVSVDQFTGNVSVFSIVDEVMPRRFPVMVSRMAAVVGWNAAAEELGQQIPVRITVQIPGRQELLEASFDFTVEGRRHRHVNHFVGLPVGAEGEVVFTILLNGNPVAHHRVLVSAPDPQIPPDGWLMYQPEGAAERIQQMREHHVQG